MSTGVSEPSKVNLLSLFATPVAVSGFEGSQALADELAPVIRRRMTEEGGVIRSNVGGWHSDGNMIEWGGTAASTLLAAAVGLARKLSHFEGGTDADYDWRVMMWANVSKAGHANKLHTHPGILWAAVFYVDLGRGPGGAEDVGGDLLFEDPRFPLVQMKLGPNFYMIDATGKPQASVVRYKPKRGDLVLFPAWLRHSVSTYAGEGERISIAMNIDVTRKISATSTTEDRGAQ